MNMALCMAGGTDQGPAFHITESHFEAGVPVFFNYFGFDAPDVSAMTFHLNILQEELFGEV